MKTIYLDSEFRCHVTNDGTRTAVETDVFDGKCDDYIEGIRLVPDGKTWIREDGAAFAGPMVAPWRDYNELIRAQAEHLERLVAEMRSAYADGVASA